MIHEYENETKIESPIGLPELSNQIDRNDNQLNTSPQIEEITNCSKQSGEVSKTENIPIPSCELEIDIKMSEDFVKTLKVKDLVKPNKDIYDFCVKNSLDYLAMETIQSQVSSLIKESVNASQSHQPQQKINHNEEKEKTKANVNSHKKPIATKNKYIKTEFDFQQRSYSMTVSDKGNMETLKRNQSQSQLVNLFPYQLGITSCRVEKIKHKKTKGNKEHNKNKNISYSNSNDISQSSSYLKAIQGKCRASPLAAEENNIHCNYNPTISSTALDNNYQLSQTSQNQSKTVKELMQDPILKDRESNFYLISELNKSKLNNKAVEETINDKSSRLDKKVNYGLLIYSRTQAWNSLLKAKKSRIKQEMIKRSEDNDTFRPSVNPISKKSNENRIAKQLEYNNPNTVLKYKTYSQEKNKQLKKKYNDIEADEEDAHYKFMPEVNHYYRCKKLESTTNYPNHFEKLFNDMQIRDRNLQELTNTLFKHHSYRPKVNKNSHIKMKFDSRLVENESKSVLKKEELTQKIKNNEIYDNKTNQPLFQPKFESKSTREERIKSKETKQLIRNNNSNPIKEVKRPLNSTSEEIFESKKTSAWKTIFKILDSDDDGEISSITMNKKGLNKNVSEILQPLFNEMKEHRELLGANDFIDICNKLYQVLPYDKKKQLIEIDSSLKKQHQKESIEGNS